MQVFLLLFHLCPFTDGDYINSMPQGTLKFISIDTTSFLLLYVYLSPFGLAFKTVSSTNNAEMDQNIVANM
jgi:hypothetical protein